MLPQELRTRVEPIPGVGVAGVATFSEICRSRSDSISPGVNSLISRNLHKNHKTYDKNQATYSKITQPIGVDSGVVTPWPGVGVGIGVKNLGIGSTLACD